MFGYRDEISAIPDGLLHDWMMLQLPACQVDAPLVALAALLDIGLCIRYAFYFGMDASIPVRMRVLQKPLWPERLAFSWEG
jgi:hypothetical protein